MSPLRHLLSLYHEHQARKRLDRIVAQTRSSEEITSYRIRRRQALKNRPDRQQRIAELTAGIVR